MMWRNGILLAFIVAAGVMAYQIGARLSDEAVMTIAGVSCGIVASIPLSLGLFIALTRERTAYYADEPLDVTPEPAPASYQVYRPPPPPAPQLPPQPQIIVVAPPQGMPQNFLPYGNYFSPQAAPALPAPAPMQERTFKIVGEDDGE